MCNEHNDSTNNHFPVGLDMPTVLNALPDSLAIVDQAGHILFVNDSWQRMHQHYHMQAQSFLPGSNFDSSIRTLEETTARECQPGLREWRTVLHGDQPELRIECTYTAPRNGTTPDNAPPRRHWLEFSVLPYGSGENRGVLVRQRDITPDQQRTEDLHRTQAQLAATFDAALDVMLVIDEETGIIQRANQTAETLLGYEPASLHGQHFRVLFPDDSPDTPDAWLHSLRVRGSVFEAQEFRRKDGSSILMDLSATMFAWPAGSALLAVLRDASERRAAELALEHAHATLEAEVVRRTAQLREQQRTVQAILDASPDVITCMRLDGVLEWISPAAQEIIGGQQVLTRDQWESFIDPDDRARLRAGFARLAAGEEQQRSVRYRVRHSRGAWMVLESRSRLLHEPTGEAVGIVTVSRDVTEQVYMENSLREAKDAAETAARMKDEFLANMSHELRTPLNAILGLTEALQEKIYGPLTQKQQSSLKTVEDSGRHLLGLINDMLDVARIEAGKIELVFTPINVEQLCQDSLRLVQPAAYTKHLTISITADSNVGMLYADERRLKQILVNLLSNAVKFTPELGQIGLHIWNDTATGMVSFSVWDTGIGIAPEEQERLFQPFVQIDSGLNRQHEGAGLGLMLVARLVRLHGGTVSLESTPGVGSRFTVAIPGPPPTNLDDDPLQRQYRGMFAADTASEPIAPPEDAADDPAAAQDTTTLTILLVEDTEDNITMLVDYLVANGYRCPVAHDGLEALAFVQQQRPDLILMDIQMPHMDGLEATRQIRMLPDHADVPIIALTALAMPGDKERAIQAGANDYVSKPVSLRRLMELIQRYLDTP